MVTYEKHAYTTGWIKTFFMLTEQYDEKRNGIRIEKIPNFLMTSVPIKVIDVIT